MSQYIGRKILDRVEKNRERIERFATDKRVSAKYLRNLSGSEKDNNAASSVKKLCIVCRKEADTYILSSDKNKNGTLMYYKHCEECRAKLKKTKCVDCSEEIIHLYSFKEYTRCYPCHVKTKKGSIKND